jgi:hypothetical protein
MRHGTLDLLENVEERGGDNKPSSLCDSCKAVRLASLLSDGGHLLHPNWASLENAAGACDPCRVILSHLLEAVREKLSHEDDEDNNTLVGGGIPDKLWHQRGLSTPIVLRYAPDYDPEVVAGRPRRLRLKPRDTSNIWATCGRFKANEANPTDDNSLQCHTRRRTKPDQEFYVSVLVPTHVYQGQLICPQHPGPSSNTIPPGGLTTATSSVRQPAPKTRHTGPKTTRPFCTGRGRRLYGERLGEALFNDTRRVS